MSGTSVFSLFTITQPQGKNDNTIASTQFARLASLPSWVLKTAAYTASSGDFLLVNTTTGTVTITLPLVPTIGMVVNFSDPYNTWNSYNLIVNGNGYNISSSGSTLVADVNGDSFYLLYVGGTVGWKPFNGVSSVPGMQGVAGNTTIPSNPTSGNLPMFSPVSGTLVDSGVAPATFATAANLATTNTNLTSTNTNLTTVNTALTALSNSVGFDRTDINYAFLKIAAMSGSQVGMIDGIIDPLNNLTDVNTAISAGYAANTTSGTIGLASSVGTQFLTVSTSSQAISSGDQSGAANTLAFNNSFTTTNGWGSSTAGTAASGVAWIGQDFGASNAYAVSQIQFYSFSTVAANMSSALVQYTDAATPNSSATWTTVATVALNTAASTLTTITVPSVGSHRAWRLLANANNTSSTEWAVTQLEFQITIAAGTTVSNSSQAISSGDYNTTQAAGNAFNGDYGQTVSGKDTTYWISAAAPVANTTYIGQDFGLGNAYALSQVLMYGSPTANYMPTSIALQYTDAATPNASATWTTAVTVTPSQAIGGLTFISVPASVGAHRAWRVLSLTSGTPGGSYWYVGQLVFQIAGTLTTVSNAAQAISDSQYSAAYATAYAFDLQAGNTWASNNSGPTANTSWIGNDWGAGNAVAIANVLVTQNTGNYFTNVAIQYTDSTTPNSGATWTTACTFTLPAVAGNYNIVVPSVGSHRAWRMLGTTGGSANPGVSDIQFQVLLATTAVSTPAQAISGGDTANYPVLAAFDNNNLSYWGSSQTGAAISGAAYIGQDFGSGKTAALTAVSVTTYNTAAANIFSALLQYTDSTTPNASATWTTVATVALNAAINTTTTFAVPSSAGAHRAWRLLANANLASGYGWFVAELVFYVAATPITGITLQSTALTSAVASPSSARVFVQLDSTSAVPVVNTDLLAYFSRDGGTTFVQGTLVLSETQTDGTLLYDTGSFSITSAPTGNSTMTYKLITANSKSIVLTGVGMQVRP